MATRTWTIQPVLAQTTPVQAPPEPAPTVGIEPLWVGVGAAVLALVLLVLVWVRRKKAAAARPTPPPTLPEAGPPPPAFKVELPPTELEAQKRQEAEQARRQAEELAKKRRELAESAAKAQAQEREQLTAEARALKAQEEEAKREEYRAKKAAEREAKERHEREQVEAARLQAEVAQRAREEAEAKRLEQAEAERRKVEAQAGRTLADGLDKTRTQGFMARLNGLFGQARQVDEAVLGELEEVLFTADIGVRTASKLVDLARERAKRNELSSSDKMKGVIRAEVEKIVDLPAGQPLAGGGPPHVVMVVGVNGAGKTTTIGKLAAKLTAQGKQVVVAAGDTFRAAATEQLEIWAQRAGASVVQGKEGADPSSVVFEAIQKAKQEGAAVVIADTAGRLHTKAPLMDELKKVRRVMDKALPGAPHEVLLVVDSTNGQNAIQQAKLFHEAVQVTGIALTKLDGTAKGGVIIGICDELQLPVVWVGVGETVADLRRFEPKEFVSALFD
jgi:fused signal recognition particle receptor